ncbi:MAG: hypothetical protein ACI4GZ_05590 [Ruminococcus sp.]
MKCRVVPFWTLTLLAVMFLSFSACSCSNSTGNFDVSGNDNIPTVEVFSLAAEEDIKNLVTDDDKLVINYYDAYIWTVFFSPDGSIDHMIYIYGFETDEEAASMVEIRTKELKANKTMKILSSASVGRYVVVDLEDTSFAGVERSVLEHNFSQLIVY